MCNVASRKAGAMRQDNAGNHGIAQVSHASFFLSHTNKLCGKSSCWFIEGRDSMVDPIQQPFEIFRQ